MVVFCWTLFIRTINTSDSIYIDFFYKITSRLFCMSVLNMRNESGMGSTGRMASWCAGSVSIKQHAPVVCSCCWIGEVQRVLKAGSGNDWSNRVRGTADQLSVKTADGCCTLVASGIWMAQNANKIASEYTLYFCTLLFFFVCLYFTIVLLHLMDSG